VGNRQKAEDLLFELRQRAPEQYVPSFCMAVICAGLGDGVQMYEWLDKAFDERSSWLFALRVEPMFNASRSQPRFAELVKRIA
jgi:hypothetical protein